MWDKWRAEEKIFVTRSFLLLFVVLVLLTRYSLRSLWRVKQGTLIRWHFESDINVHPKMISKSFMLVLYPYKLNYCISFIAFLLPHHLQKSGNNLFPLLCGARWSATLSHYLISAKRTSVLGLNSELNLVKGWQRAEAAKRFRQPLSWIILFSFLFFFSVHDSVKNLLTLFSKNAHQMGSAKAMG